MSRTPEKVLQAVHSLLPAPKRGAIIKMRQQKGAIVVGCIYEMCSAYSANELAPVLNISHITVLQYKKQWDSMPWPDRYAWLRLVDGRLNNWRIYGTNTVDAPVLRRPDQQYCGHECRRVWSVHASLVSLLDARSHTD